MKKAISVSPYCETRYGHTFALLPMSYRYPVETHSDSVNRYVRLA